MKNSKKNIRLNRQKSVQHLKQCYFSKLNQSIINYYHYKLVIYRGIFNKPYQQSIRLLKIPKINAIWKMYLCNEFPYEYYISNADE